MESEINKQKISILKLLWSIFFLQGEISLVVDDVKYYRTIEIDENDPTPFMKRLIFKWYKYNIKDNKFYDKSTRIYDYDMQQIKDALSKSLNKNTTFKCSINSLYLIDKEIDWKVFLKANITLQRNMGHRHKIEEFKYNLKDLPEGFNGILNSNQYKYTGEKCIVELTLPLDINYMVTKTKAFALIMGSHKRLGEKSEVLSLDDDMLYLIVSKC
jgi:hypothetical protein